MALCVSSLTLLAALTPSLELRSETIGEKALLEATYARGVVGGASAVMAASRERVLSVEY